MPITVLANKNNVAVTLTVASGAITDAAGNGNSVSSAYNFIVNTAAAPALAAPTLSFSSPLSSPGNDTTPSFSLSVPALSTAKLYQGNACTGTAVGSVANTGASAADKTITLTPALSSDATYNFYAQIEKTADTTIKSACSTALSYVLDTTAPTVTFSGIASGAEISKYGDNIVRTLIVTFNEDIKAGATLLVGEITETDSGNAMTVGVPARQSNTSVWHIRLTLADDKRSSVTLRVNANAVQDLVGNGNAVSGSHTFIIDTVRPTAVLSGISGTIASAQTLTITFSEVVSGLVASEVEITEGSNAVTVGALSPATGSSAVWTIPITRSPLRTGLI